MSDKTESTTDETRGNITESAGTDNASLPYAHWLYNVPGLGSRTIKYLLSKGKTPSQLYRTAMKSEEELERMLSLSAKGRETAHSIAQSARTWDLYGAYEKMQEKKIRFTHLGHEDYPGRLSQIPDAPYGIYYKGKLPAALSPAAAIIGARSCSDYGRQIAEKFGRDLSAAGIQIISGMARGIDGIGQGAALGAGGYSLGVMGCGVDICYPKENEELYEMLCIRGGICSEYPPGTMPRSSLFPPRNRIISALSDAVLVVEAKSRSGTLITVDMALEQGKEVYAVPGRITEALSEGCNRLLQQGAQPALSPAEIIQNLTGRMPSGQETLFLLSDLQSCVLQNLDDTPQSLEKIKERMLSNCGRDISMPELMNQLVKLHLNGLVRQIGNSYFMKI